MYVFLFFYTLGPINGVLPCDKYTCRRVVCCGAFLLALGCVISYFATSILFLYLSFGVIAGKIPCTFTTIINPTIITLTIITHMIITPTKITLTIITHLIIIHTIITFMICCSRYWLWYDLHSILHHRWPLL